MEQLGKFFVSAGEGMIMLFFLLIGALVAWQMHRAHPKASRLLAWLLMMTGIACASFSSDGAGLFKVFGMRAGVYFAILGAILLAICDSRKPSP